MGIEQKKVKQNSLTEHLIRLAYTELILEHAQTDSPEEFAKNLQQDINTSETDEAATADEQIEKTKEDQPPEHIVQVGHAEQPEQHDPSKKGFFNKLKANKPALICSTVALIALLPAVILLFWSNIYYKGKILPGTTYGSIKLSSSPSEARNQIEEASSAYKITLQFNQDQTSYAPSDLGLSIDVDKTLDNARQQSNKVRFFARPLSLFAKRTTTSSTALDQAKFKEFLVAQNYSDKIPEDAKIEFSESQSKFIAVPEVAGRGIDLKALEARIISSLETLSSSPLELKIEDVPPAIIAANLSGPVEEANAVLNQKVTIASPGKNYTPSTTVMKDWVVLTADPANSTYKISLNEDAEKKYIDTVVSKVNRKMEKRLYATINGSEMLLQNGVSGLQVLNTDSAKNQITGLVRSKKGGTIVLEAKEDPPTSENIAASGGRWIFADISQFRIYAYEGANLVNSFAMSSGKSSTPTPTGNYSVISKVRVKTMTSGGNKNSRDYYSVPNIEWVAYFKSGGYAMHGVYWHNKFGVENTSHGCMGMSNASAQWVYNFVEVGTPVIVVS